MDTLEIRTLLAEALCKSEMIDQVLPVGNAVHAYADGQEFEIVIRTVRRERTWDLDTNGLRSTH